LATNPPAFKRTLSQPAENRNNNQITSNLLADLREQGRKSSTARTSATNIVKSKQTPTTKQAPTPQRSVSPEVKADPYLKSVFPTVEEYLLLDVLTNNDNNVQKAADKLVKMGYVKRDTPSAPRLHARRKEEERLAEKRTPLPKPPPIKTDKEKDDLRKKMKDKYETKYDIPERILFMALESVLFDEEQANNLVLSMIEDDLKRKKSKEAEKAKEKAKEKHTRKSPKPNRRSMDAEKIASHPSPKHEPKKMTSHGKKGWTSKSNIKEEVLVKPASKASNTTSQTTQVCSGRALGPNPSLRKGPNDDLLLTDYVTWNGN
jgi:hypothetical protein